MAEEARARVLVAGADEFMRKPFRHSELLERIGTLAGVEYERSGGPPEFSGPGHGLAPQPAKDSLGRLPADLIGALRTANAAADYDRLLTLADEVSRLDASLGHELHQLVQNFEYAALETLLGPERAAGPPRSEPAGNPEAF